MESRASTDSAALGFIEAEPERACRTSFGGELEVEAQGAVERGLAFLERKQTADGTWPEHYGGPSFLLPLYVFAAAFCGREIAADERAAMVRQLYAIQLDDWSVGINVEAREGTMFGTVLAYVALRLLGESPDAHRVAPMRDWIRARGGPLVAASWGKFMLALLGLYDYRGVIPVPPELHLLPHWLPVHPSRLSGYVREVYLPMSFLYRARAARPVDAFTESLRRELFSVPWAEVDFAGHRHTLYGADDLVPYHWVPRAVTRLLVALEAMTPRWLARKALARAHEHVVYQGEVSDYIHQAQVNAVYNTLVHHVAGDRALAERCWQQLEKYRWEEDGRVDYKGFTSVKSWDNGFFLKMFAEVPNTARTVAMARRAYRYLDDHQIKTELADPHRYYRLPRLGAWPLNEIGNGWAITDCTAECLQGVLRWRDTVDRPIDDRRVAAAVRFLLGYQNQDGGWATCDRARGGPWLEWLNPTHLFVDCMVDHSFPECTASVVEGLLASRDRVPALADAIDVAVDRGVRYILSQQAANGGWYAAWGICFTYGTAFALQGLRAAGLPVDHPAIQRGSRFLLARQLPDGGWGEQAQSARRREYLSTAEGLVEQTAWAVLGLIAGGYGDTEAVARGVRFLVARQRSDGDWPRQPIAGACFGTLLFDYRNYRRYFPLLALSRFLRPAHDLAGY